MVALKWSVFTAAFAATSVAAFDVRVGSKGGNATNGHQYGFLHEVNLFLFGVIYQGQK
jgi:alpha-N-arabinofuranosidase